MNKVAMYYGGKKTASGGSIAGSINVSVAGSSGNKEEVEYVVADAIYNRNSLTVIEETSASTSAENNSEYFEDEYLVVNDGAYKLDADGMISLVGKKMVGTGSVRWNEWPAADETFASYDTAMNAGALKVRYSDDPIYMSMKIPSEARIEGKDSRGNNVDFVTHPGMKPTNSGHATNHFQYINSLGAIMPADYTKLPNEIVICIGRLAVYTLSKEPNAKWELFDYVDRPLPDAAMYYLPWADCHDNSEKIDSSKKEEFEGYTRYTLTKSDFAPNTSVEAASIAKTLHFWGNAYKEIDIDNTLAIIELFEVWTETPAAVPWLYTAAGVDRKNDAGTISQAFWGRNVLLSTEKTVIAGHNISDELYDKLRDTGADPRFVYADYTQGKTWGYDIKQIQSSMSKIEAAGEEIEANSQRSTASYSVLEIVSPGLNINPGEYVYKVINADGSITTPTGYPAKQGIVSADYIPVRPGATICQHFDPEEWNNWNAGAGIYLTQYDANKVQIGTQYTLNQFWRGNSLTLNADTAYIKIGYTLWKDDYEIDTDLKDIKIAVYYIEDGRAEFVPYGVGGNPEFAVDGDKVVLTSPNGTKFKLSVSDEGALNITAF